MSTTIDLDALMDLLAEKVAAKIIARMPRPPAPQPAQPPTDRLTVADVATHLKVEAETVRGWIRAGALRASRIGAGGPKSRVWRITRSDVEAFEAARSSTHESDSIEAEADRILSRKRRR